MPLALRDARHVLLTGAAGAIGGALADRLHEQCPGARFTLLDRDRAGLDAVAARVGGRAVACDLSQVASLDALWADATREQPVDVLVSCAGIMEMVTFARTSWELGSTLLAIDLLSPLRLMSLAVPSMRERGLGIVVNVSSMAGLVPLRGASYYGAAKAGLAMASEIARMELGAAGVHVLTVYPGPVTSGLERRAREQVGGSWLAGGMPTGEPGPLADRIVLAMREQRARVVYPSLYEVGFRALGLSRLFAERFSPEPSV